MLQDNIGLKNRIRELEASSGGDQASFRDLQAKLDAALKENSNLKSENDRLN
jgi:regulator of replication initiation timing